MTKYVPRQREAPPSGVFAHLGSIFDHFGIVCRTQVVKFRTTIVKRRTNFVPIIANTMTRKVPIIFHIKHNLHKLKIWVQNPRFELKLCLNRPVSVQITPKLHSRGLGTDRGTGKYGLGVRDRNIGFKGPGPEKLELQGESSLEFQAGANKAYKCGPGPPVPAAPRPRPSSSGPVGTSLKFQAGVNLQFHADQPGIPACLNPTVNLPQNGTPIKKFKCFCSKNMSFQPRDCPMGPLAL